MAVLNYYHIGKTIPEGAVYIGRAQPAKGLSGSKFANPEWLPPGSSEEDRGANLNRYRKWLVNQVKSGKITHEDLLALEGRDLVCFCKPKACHGDVVSEAVAWAVKQRAKPDFTNEAQLATAANPRPPRP